MVLFSSGGQAHRQRIQAAALAGVDWLLAVQNADGGWPTFCRGWGKLPFDRSGTDLTAHAIRALHAWHHWFPDRDIDWAIREGLDFLAARQRSDGSWHPLWFGNQYHEEEANPVYGTSRVIFAYRDLGLIESEPAQRGLVWLASHAGADGGWGAEGKAPGLRPGGTAVVGNPPSPIPSGSTAEETALAVEALLADPANLSLQALPGRGDRVA